MLARLLIALSCFCLVPGLAQAQFGPKPPTPPSPQELYGDRMYSEGSRLLNGTSDNSFGAEERYDFDKAQNRFDQARTAYEGECNNREAPKDQWSRNCYKLANMYRRAIGVKQDYNYARRLYDAACLDGDHIASCTQQAYTSHIGSNGKIDYPHARLLYERACGLKDARGCAGLGNMLYRGQGGPQDRTRGSRLLQQSCADNYDWACERLKGFGIPETLERF